MLKTSKIVGKRLFVLIFSSLMLCSGSAFARDYGDFDSMDLSSPSELAPTSTFGETYIPQPGSERRAMEIITAGEEAEEGMALTEEAVKKERGVIIPFDRVATEGLIAIEDTERVPPSGEKAAPGRVKEGGWSEYIFSKIHPYMSTDFCYDGNIYNIQNNKKDDFVNTTKAGSKMIFGKGSTRVQIDGGVKAAEFFYSAWNTLLPYASAGAYTKHGDYSFSFNHFFKRDFAPLTSFVSTEPGFTHYFYNETIAKAKADYGRTKCQVMWRRFEYEFSDPDRKPNNNIVNGLFLTASHHPLSTPNTTFLAEYDLGGSEYSKAGPANDFTYHLVAVGVAHRFGAKLSLIVKGGFEYLDYRDNKDFQTFPITAYLRYTYSPKTIVALSAYSGADVSPNPLLYTFDSRRLELGCYHHFNPNFTIYTGAYALQYTSKSPKWTDNGWGCTVQLSYALKKWMRVSSYYTYDMIDAGGSRPTGFIHPIYGLKLNMDF